jgi:hypothetical protein
MYLGARLIIVSFVENGDNMKLVGLMGLIGLVAGCATEYTQKTAFSDGGFSDVELQPNYFRVKFEGNSLTPLEQAEEFSMLRAGELCLSRGAKYMVLSNRNAQHIISRYIPATSTSATSSSINQDKIEEVTTVTHKPEEPVYSPEAGLTVACMHQKSSTTWDVEFLVNSLKTKYKLK